jgi:hypothetical protein
MISTPSSISLRGFLVGAALTAIALLLVLKKSYVKNKPSSNNLRLPQLQDYDEEEDHYFPHRHHPYQVNDTNTNKGVSGLSSADYFVFLQKFPLQNTFKMIFHTEVVVCPRQAFAKDANFLESLDALVQELPPSSYEDITRKDTYNKLQFATVAKNQWSVQFEPTCVQLGYGGRFDWSAVDNAYEFCRTACCGSPHKKENTNYALNSKQAVIENAMGDDKEVYLYGVSKISGEDAYRAVCHGHMNAVEEDKLPVCVSIWAGVEYSALTNNCNTFTSTVLKCVFGMSDDKPSLGVSDLVKVSCPKKKINNKDVQICAVPKSRDWEKEGVADFASVQ